MSERFRQFLADTRERFSAVALPRMGWVETVLTGLYGGAVLAAFAIFASAAPNMFSDDLGNRCWSTALATASLAAVGAILLAIPMLILSFGFARLFVWFGRRLHRRLRGRGWSGWRKKLGEFLSSCCWWYGMIWWVVTAAAGAVTFIQLLTIAGFILNNPPALPADREDRAACRRLITDTRPPFWLMEFLQTLGTPG
jgi:hypothetical protein